MKKVVTINLNGRAYQIEEEGYAELKTYLGQAAKRLSDDPDHDEIIADFEQAVADKCDQVLKNGKTVVSEKEINEIIAEMGPVDSAAETKSTTAPSGSPKRFYLIKEGSMVGGVATGVASYFNLDVTVVRLAMVLLAFITSGAAVGAYIIAMIVAPQAKTPEQKAAARGARFNADELIDTARRKYQELSGDRPNLEGLGQGIRNLLRLIAGIIAVVAGLAVFGVVVVGVSGLWSLLFSGTFFGHGLVTSSPSWLLALFIGSGLIVGLLPVLLVALLSYQYAKTGGLKASPVTSIFLGAVFTLAVITFIAIPASSASIRDTIHHYHHTQLNSDNVEGCIDGCPEITVPPVPSQ